MQALVEALRRRHLLLVLDNSLGPMGGLSKAATSASPSVDSIGDVLLGPVKGTGTHNELLGREAETAMAACFAAIRPIAPRSPNKREAKLTGVGAQACVNLVPIADTKRKGPVKDPFQAHFRGSPT